MSATTIFFITFFDMEYGSLIGHKCEAEQHHLAYSGEKIDMALIVQLHDDVVVKKIPLDKPTVRIGRDPAVDIIIDDRVVSQEHAVVEIVDPPDRKGEREYYVKDLGSTNGTFVNDKAIARQRLSDGDLIRVGWTMLKFFERNDPANDKTLKIHKSWIPGVYYTKD